MRSQRAAVFPCLALLAVAWLAAEALRPRRPTSATDLLFEVVVDGPDDDVAGRVASAFEGRLEARKIRGARVETQGRRHVRVRLPRDFSPERVEWVAALLATRGLLALAIEVRPREDYRRDLGAVWAADGVEPRRLEEDPPWGGTPEEFHEFKAREVRRWTAAQAAGEAYQPSDPRYRLARRFGARGNDPGDFVVLEQDEVSRRLTGDMVEDAQATEDPTGRPVVTYRVARSHQEVFERWTERNVGLPLAIVLDQTFHASPWIKQPLRDNVQIAMGADLRAHARQEAERLAAALATPLPAPVRRR